MMDGHGIRELLQEVADGRMTVDDRDTDCRVSSYPKALSLTVITPSPSSTDSSAGHIPNAQDPIVGTPVMLTVVSTSDPRNALSPIDDTVYSTPPCSTVPSNTRSRTSPPVTETVPSERTR